MDHFIYKNGLLHAENVPITKICDAINTPFYCYSVATIERHFKVLESALEGLKTTICYAVKANSNIAVLKLLGDMGAGADVVSSGELIRALKAGIPNKKIVFSGVGKTKEEITHALKENILQINVESEVELHCVNNIARDLNKVAEVALRINPDVDALTHEKISTGRSENKFGIEWNSIDKVINSANKLQNIEIAGLAVHIGSQLTDLKPFRDTFKKLKDLVIRLELIGAKFKRLDLGGGLGIPYNNDKTPSPQEYGIVIREILGDMKCNLIVEPGRLIVGNAGILVTKVIYYKKGDARNFVILDAAMNDLMRPSLYDAEHEIINVIETNQNVEKDAVDIVGPVCETGDTFARQVRLSKCETGDLFAIRSAGAYGATMSSTYNSRALIPEVMVNKSRYTTIRERIEPETYLNYEKIPDW
ncbi:MAG: diaminopimelate decarboxylase [Rhodospirillales bacterium]|tara:strand:- start:1138 stop:2394 length:1257 start_codon:yes stop_codon:yes gene_type:complete